MKTAGALVVVAGSCFAQLAGTVRDSASKLPVEGARVAITGPASKSLESNGMGAFRLEDAPPGRYTVRFSKPKFDPGIATVDVKPGGSSVTLELKPWAEVEGRILDEDGKPMEGVPVYVGGLRDTTGKDGRYHAKDISGGQYTLSFQVPYEVRRETALRDAKTGETFGYANTLFYPGVADRKLAAAVTIAPGAHLANFDIRLRRTPLVEMRGNVVDAFPETEVELDSAGDRPDQTFARRKLDERGGFTFDLLPPREYLLAIHRNRPGDDLPYLKSIHVGQTGVQDLEVPLPPFVRIEGVVRMEHPDVGWEGSLRVTLDRLGYRTEIRVSPEGRFGLNAIPPGEWTLLLDDTLLTRAGDVKRRLYVIGLRGKALHVSESGNPPLEITLTDQTGRIAGTSEDQGPVMVRSVGEGFSFMRVAVPQADGSFTVELPPGDYRVGNCEKQLVDVTVQGGATATVQLKACPR